MTEERILTVLNVDDYPAALYATSRVLRQAGYRVLERPPVRRRWRAPGSAPTSSSWT
jgi:response regulator RpfG family c-di-GMP phosphodiesterase